MEKTKKTAIEMLLEFLNQIRNSPTELELSETNLGVAYPFLSMRTKLEIGVLLGRLMHPSPIQKEQDIRDGNLDWLGHGKSRCVPIKSVEHEARLLLELFCGLFGMVTSNMLDTHKRNYPSINYSIGENLGRLCASLLDKIKGPFS